MSGAIFKSTSVVGLTTLLSRITGMLRDVAQAQLFGGGPMADAFLVAYKIPNFLRRLFAEGAFSQSFVPVVSQYKHQQGEAEVKELVTGVAGTLGLTLFVVTLIGVIGAPVIIWAFAPGFQQHGGRYDLAVEMLRWTFPYLFFISLTALASGVLNSYGRFGAPAFTQVLMNLVMIVAAVWVAPHFENPGLVLAIAVFVSGVVQVLFQLPFILRLRLLGWPRWRWDHAGVRRVGRLMVPGILGSSMAQVSLLLDTQIASFLVTGSVTWMYFADRLVEFPLGVFSIALATVILPNLSGHHAAEAPERFSATLDWALRLVVLMVVPAAVALFMLAGPLTATFFRHGRFGAGLFLRTARIQLRQSAGAGVFRPPGHPDAGARQLHLSRSEHRPQRPRGRTPRLLREIAGPARLFGPVHRHLGRHELLAVVSGPAQERGAAAGSRLERLAGAGGRREHRDGGGLVVAGRGSRPLDRHGHLAARAADRNLRHGRGPGVFRHPVRGRGEARPSTPLMGRKLHYNHGLSPWNSFAASTIFRPIIGAACSRSAITTACISGISR
jgi:putative peptidoglycan lipid II flippase